MSRVIVFGAGPSGERALAALQPRHEVLAFCDNNWQKFSAGFGGLPVVAPATLVTTDFDRVVLATGYACQVHEQLEALGVAAERITGLDYYAAAGPVLPSVAPGYLRVPGVTTLEERNWLYHQAARHQAGQGAVVELGVWFGALSRAILEGLEKDGPSEAVRDAHFFDTFISWPGSQSQLGGWSQAPHYRDGASFLTGFQAMIQPWQDRCQVHAEDLAHYQWPGGDIGLLVVDAMNSWPLALRIAREFLPCLVPGKGLVFHQDFSHWATPWLHLIMYRLRENFVAVDDVPGGTVVFRCTRAVPDQILAGVAGIEAFAAPEIAAALDWSLAQISDPQKQAGVLAAYVHANVQAGRPAAARELLARGRSLDPENHELNLAARLLAGPAVG